MSDLKMLKELGAQLDPQSDGPPARLRYRVLNNLDVPPVRRKRWWQPSWRWSLAVSGGLAAVLVAALTFGVGSAPANAAAREVLLRAAAFQRADTGPPPRPDQLVYVQSISAYPRGGQIPAIQPKMRQIWQSVDGRHDGLLQESALPGKAPTDDIIPNAPFTACIDGKAAVVDQQWKVRRDEFQECSVEPAYRPELPTDAAGMLNYLRSTAPRERNDFDILDNAMSLIHEKYTTPGQLAAIFEAISQLPSVAVIPEVVDLHGRRGVAVAMMRAPVVYQLIFDPETFAYLGFQSVATEDFGEYKRGDITGGHAILVKAIVDQIGQVP